MKKLFLLTREDFDYDEAAGFVVRAESEDKAREIAARHAGDEGKQVWLLKAKCTEVKASGRSGIILRSFRHG